MKNLGRYFSHKEQGQRLPIPGRNMVKNNAGGYVFKVSPEIQLSRFLLMGTTKGSYYQSVEDLTLDNTTNVIQLADKDPSKVLEICKRHYEKKWYIYPYPLMAVTSYLTTKPQVREDAFQLLNKLAYTPFNFFTILKYLRDMRGFGRSVRRFIQNWYLSKNKHTLTYQLLKYRSRNGWTHRDALLLGHVKPKENWQQEVFKTIVDINKGNISLSQIELDDPFAQGIRELYSLENPSVSQIINVVTKYRLTWDVIPTEYLNNVDLWKGMIENNLVPPEAVLRQLRRLLVLDYKDADRLAKILQRGKFTFYQILRAYAILSSTTFGDLLVDLLKERFTKDKDDVEINNFLIAVDTSGSMTSTVSLSYRNDGDLSCLYFARIFAGYLCHMGDNKYIEFDTHYYEREYPTLYNYRYHYSGGGTDTSLPFQYIKDKNLYHLSGVIVFTDSETWAGREHAQALLEEIRKVNPAFIAVNVPLTANSYSSFDDEPLNFEIAGCVPDMDILIKNFIDITREYIK